MTKRAIKRERPNMAATPSVIEFLLDETGSMDSCKPATIGGFNDFLTEQQQAGSCLLTLTKFDSNGLRTPYTDVDIAMVPAMTDQTFCPAGMTNLRDAIVTRLAVLSDRLATWDVTPQVLLVVMTDGGDNASRATVHATRTAVNAATERGWTCVFLASHAGAVEAADELGFLPGNVRLFAADQTRQTMQTLAHATTAFRSAAVQTANFFAAV